MCEARGGLMAVLPAWEARSARQLAYSRGRGSSRSNSTPEDTELGAKTFAQGQGTRALAHAYGVEL